VNRVVVGAGLLVWIGATLMLSRSTRLSRPGLAERLRPFSPGGATAAGSAGLFSVESVRDVVGPLARLCGDRLAALFGVTEPLANRLRRVHSDMDVTAFRVRQLAVAGLAIVASAVLAVGLGWPPVVSIVVVAGAPLLAFLIPEQRLVRASESWQRDLALELPVVAEQLAMLLNAGYSLGSALARLSQRGHGSAARDLGVVVNRVRQGLSESEALREWAEVARVDAVDRLVSVLSLHTESSDLGRLVSSEARQARRDLQRRTIESIERRAQQVWVPVTVATLVPGVILLAVPFLAALRLFANA
jgi:pilus assembly protein TadC